MFHVQSSSTDEALITGLTGLLSAAVALRREEINALTATWRVDLQHIRNTLVGAEQVSCSRADVGNARKAGGDASAIEVAQR